MLKRDVGNFEVGEYLESRSQNPNFIAVEFGHREKPIAFSEATDFTGDRAYIGIEANLRNGYGFMCLDDMVSESGLEDSNVFFIDHVVGRIKSGWDDVEIDGDYQAETILPPDIANEVFAGNVVCDPIVAHNEKRTNSFIEELARVVAPAGRIILRETITPKEIKYLKSALAISGLSRVATITPQCKEWTQLEKVYDCDYDPFYSCISKSSFYMFLQKSDAI